MHTAWTDLTVAGKRVEIYTPPTRPRFGVLYLHPLGLEMLRDRPAFTEPLARFNFACIAPHGQRSWWVDRVCPEFDPRLTAERHVIDNMLPLFANRFGLSLRAIGVFGISMGGQGALRLAFKYPHLFGVAAGIASALDFQEYYGEGLALDDMYDSKEHCRQDTAILHVQPGKTPPHIWFACDPDDERCYRGNDRLHEKLTALGVEHTCDLTTQAGGHTWAYFDKMAEPALRFVHDALEAESRRLL